MSINQARMAELTKQLPSKSAKMRALARAGYSRSDIARFLGTSYQFVRNVLIQEEAKRADAKSEEHRTGNPVAQDEAALRSRIRVEGDGTVTLPRVFAEAVGSKPGDVLFARVDGDEIHLLTPQAAMKHARAIIRQFVPEGVSLVDELIEERRREAERELGDG